MRVFFAGPVNLFLEDGFCLDGFELGLEVFDAMANRGRVGAAARIGYIVAIVLEFVALATPVPFLFSNRFALWYVGRYVICIWR